MRLAIEYEPDDIRQVGFVDDLRRMLRSRLDETDPDLIVVVGGDGAMLRALRRHTPQEGPWRPRRFFGIGRGTRNFLMNEESVAEKLMWLREADLDVHPAHPIRAYLDGRYLGLAYNEAVLGSSVMGWHRFDVRTAHGDISFQGSAACAATPLGSTGFSMNVGGPVLPLEEPVLAYSSVAADRQVLGICRDSLTIDFETRASLAVHLDGRISDIRPEIRDGLGRSRGTVLVERVAESRMELAFVDGKSFLQRRMGMNRAGR